MNYPVVIERGEENFSGYPLDIEGIYAFGKSESEILEKLTRAIEERLAEYRAEGKSAPSSSHTVRTIHVAA